MLFIFQPGVWLGEGTIAFSSSPEKIRFFVKWNISKEDNQEILCKQQIEMQGVGEALFNHYRLFKIQGSSFSVELENAIAGIVPGTGLLTESQVAWEFSGHPLFEGFEVYNLSENGNYTFHAEYVSTDAHRTTIEGHLWKKFQ
jgi:hypothetical protein